MIKQMTGQMAFFCSCGAGIFRQGLCRHCYWSHRHSLRHFGGHRQRVLNRDRHRCRVCANGGGVIVHHRRPGSNRIDLLITLCLACHARIHRTLVLRRWTPPLRELWEEVRPNGPVQLLLFAAPPADAFQRAA